MDQREKQEFKKRMDSLLGYHSDISRQLADGEIHPNNRELAERALKIVEAVKSADIKRINKILLLYGVDQKRKEEISDLEKDNKELSESAEPVDDARLKRVQEVADGRKQRLVAAEEKVTELEKKVTELDDTINQHLQEKEVLQDVISAYQEGDDSLIKKAYKKLVDMKNDQISHLEGLFKAAQKGEQAYKKFVLLNQSKADEAEVQAFLDMHEKYEQAQAKIKELEEKGPSPDSGLIKDLQKQAETYLIGITQVARSVGYKGDLSKIGSEKKYFEGLLQHMEEMQSNYLVYLVNQADMPEPLKKQFYEHYVSNDPTNNHYKAWTCNALAGIFMQEEEQDKAVGYLREGLAAARVQYETSKEEIDRQLFEMIESAVEQLEN